MLPPHEPSITCARLESPNKTSVGDKKNACFLVSISAEKAEALLGGYNRADVVYKSLDCIQLVEVCHQWLSDATHVNELINSVRRGEFVVRASEGGMFSMELVLACHFDITNPSLFSHVIF